MKKGKVLEVEEIRRDHKNVEFRITYQDERIFPRGAYGKPFVVKEIKVIVSSVASPQWMYTGKLYLKGNSKVSDNRSLEVELGSVELFLELIKEINRYYGCTEELCSI